MKCEYLISGVSAIQHKKIINKTIKQTADKLGVDYVLEKQFPLLMFSELLNLICQG